MEKTIIAADTGSALTYDRSGDLVSDTSKATHLWDVLKREYKKCGYCHKWYLLDSFSKSDRKASKDGHINFCSNCEQRKAAKNTAAKIEKAVKAAVNPVTLTDDELLDELRSRGFSGTLTKKIEVEL